MRCRKGGEERGKEEGVVDPAFIHSPWLSFVPPHVLQSRGYLGQARAGELPRVVCGLTEVGPSSGRTVDGNGLCHHLTRSHAINGSSTLVCLTFAGKHRVLDDNVTLVLGAVL